MYGINQSACFCLAVVNLKYMTACPEQTLIRVSSSWAYNCWLNALIFISSDFSLKRQIKWILLVFTNRRKICWLFVVSIWVSKSIWVVYYTSICSLRCSRGTGASIFCITTTGIIVPKLQRGPVTQSPVDNSMQLLQQWKKRQFVAIAAWLNWGIDLIAAGLQLEQRCTKDGWQLHRWWMLTRREYSSLTRRI